jgi:CheY-like chemotaxis protein
VSDSRPVRVLVVDDEPLVREYLVRALETGGYEVVAVEDGLAGLEAAQTAPRPYDLVVTNSHMPGLRGEELIGRLREVCPGLPVLYLDDLAQPIGPNAEGVPSCTNRSASMPCSKRWRPRSSPPRSHGPLTSGLPP